MELYPAEITSYIEIDFKYTSCHLNSKRQITKSDLYFCTQTNEEYLDIRLDGRKEVAYPSYLNMFKYTETLS